MQVIIEHLVEEVHYQKWANDLWFEFIESSKSQHHGGQFAVQAEKWMWHIEGCYRGWLNSALSENEERAETLEKSLENAYLRLMKFVTQKDLDSLLVSEKNEDTVALNYRQIVHHTLNHATYHRGHLRALAEQHGLTDWPETDYVRFARRTLSTVS